MQPYSYRVCGGLLVLSASVAFAEIPQPVDQMELMRRLDEDRLSCFNHAFEAGDEITEATYTMARGVGARVAEGQYFTRLPRADLADTGDWAQHEPQREGGPQAHSCISCHSVPLANGAGPLAMNVAIDPLHSGEPGQFLERNTLHLFGLGAVQRIAEEMTQELKAQEALVAEQACAKQEPVTLALTAKGISFGDLTATPEAQGESCTGQIDYEQLYGVADDLIIRAFGWKGTHITLRSFARGAAHNEMGMQAVELVGDADGDHDGVTGELSIGDLTAVTLYMAALERPTSKLELADLGLTELTDDERARIERGEARLAEAACTSCHVPSLELEKAVFSEPSAVPGFAEEELPSGADARALGLDPDRPLWFDLTKDQPNNRITLASGEEVLLGAFAPSGEQGATVTWYSDFRRHDMGPALADPVDAYGMGASVWPTRSLAGVGSTGPWLHHGHATTLREAILAHGGEAEASKAAFAAMPEDQQQELIAFLENLVIENFDPEEEDH